MGTVTALHRKTRGWRVQKTAKLNIQTILLVLQN